VASFDAAIPPGKAGKVTAQVHTESYRGPVEKTIAVSSNDTTHPSVVLHVKANIVGSVEILPRWYVSFPDPRDWAYKALVIIRKEKSETGELKIAELTTSSPWLTAVAHRVDRADPPRPGPPQPDSPPQEKGDWVIDIGMTDEAPGGQSGQQVRFKTGLTREPEVTLPVSVVLQQAMHLTPQGLNLPFWPGAKTATNVFHLDVRPGLGKQQVNVRVAPASFTVKLEPDGERRYKGTVVWTPEGEKPEKTGEVALTIGAENASLALRVNEKPPGTSPSAAAGVPANKAAPAQEEPQARAPAAPHSFDP
jgi:hypothetical protein